MIKKNIFLFVLFNTIGAQQDTLETKAHEITHTIFGNTGLDSPLDVRISMQQLIYDCLRASPYQLELAAHFTIIALEKKLDEVQAEIDRLKTKQENVPQKLFYKQFLCKKQIDHLHEFITMTIHDITTWQKFHGLLHRGYELIMKYGKEFFGYAYEPITAQQLSQEIVDYIDYERENILYDYATLHTFLRGRSETTLPTIIDFWDTRKVQQQLAKRAKLVSNKVKVQLVEILASMALQGMILAGGQVSDQLISGRDRKVLEQIQQRQQKIAQSWQAFQQKIQQDQKQIFNNIITAFKQSQTKLQAEYQTSNVRLREALVYLNQSINLAQPISHYLNQPVIWDQYFAASPMFTPRKDQQWYNLFNFYASPAWNYAAGDWEFDSQTNSFWQNGMTPMPKTLLWNTKDGNIFDNDPSIRSIFTEYVPSKFNYDIEIECTLVNCQYPFFVGIMFNRGRWISGDPERIHWYRLVGLYGVEEKPGDKTTQAINLTFAQQLLDIPKTKNGKEKITSPLEQIMNNKTAGINFALDKKDVSSLASTPITFVFKITTQPDTFVIELDKKTNGSVQKLYSGSVHNLDPYIYLFHGIGFMAVGCQAQFKINKPAELIYQQQELKEFEKKIQTLTK